mmetsp:Transcript_49157/g.117189  ORF Transcript_49157/g.117189 Transcript_49157/m.117189 type:complete len:93 (+) Transcript_49157:591-869(+)
MVAGSPCEISMKKSLCGQVLLYIGAFIPHVQLRMSFAQTDLSNGTPRTSLKAMRMDGELPGSMSDLLLQPGSGFSQRISEHGALFEETFSPP